MLLVSYVLVLQKTTDYLASCVMTNKEARSPQTTPTLVQPRCNWYSFSFLEHEKKASFAMPTAVSRPYVLLYISVAIA